jgi:hypothetical protein
MCSALASNNFANHFVVFFSDLLSSISEFLIIIIDHYKIKKYFPISFFKIIYVEYV